jgi:hypothetical protein
MVFVLNLVYTPPMGGNLMPMAGGTFISALERKANGSADRVRRIAKRMIDLKFKRLMAT